MPRLPRVSGREAIRVLERLGFKYAQAGLTDEVRSRVGDGGIFIEPVNPSRSGWAEAAREMHQRNEDSLLEPPTATHFDETEWAW